jgi:hypothetical protein
MLKTGERVFSFLLSRFYYYKLFMSRVTEAEMMREKTTTTRLSLFLLRRWLLWRFKAIELLSA